MPRPASTPTVLMSLPEVDLKAMFQDSPTEFLEKFSDVLTDILAERNAILHSAFADLLIERLIQGGIFED